MLIQPYRAALHDAARSCISFLYKRTPASSSVYGMGVHLDGGLAAGRTAGTAAAGLTLWRQHSATCFAMPGVGGRWFAAARRGAGSGARHKRASAAICLISTAAFLRRFAAARADKRRRAFAGISI